MRKIIVLLAIAFAACNSHNNVNIERTLASATPTPSVVVASHPQDDVRRITTAELDGLMKQGKVVIVDVRTKDAYDRAHITGAKLIPLPVIGQRAGELPRDKMIVTYCS
ncbi:MAG TPA: rhodanese-like domain-containing protein [Pyrinomonadaceae bacterium]|nr:rhodanese-like domain-containing protein [Pyrinomonadaceae bacterium]